MRKRETAVCGTACTVVWEVGKCESRRQMPFMISIYLLPDYRFRNRATRLVKLTLRGVIPWKLNAIMRHPV